MFPGPHQRGLYNQPEVQQLVKLRKKKSASCEATTIQQECIPYLLQEAKLTLVCRLLLNLLIPGHRLALAQGALHKLLQLSSE
ncbi:hypothetical protein RHMOL_Rhmol02G0242000 [Rhododendron molle]|uniref:Uncharacterized protein n=1 Tax=Rhododendron molle TaxID=49168 RepID=A0ACC0PUZ3_RHOML|nr:hypothetical protein RHMOL_Rhmol02G0242000 [Rhododendron molle]